VDSEIAVSLVFSTDEAAKIARGQENQVTNIREGAPGTTKGDGIRIFRLNEAEKKEVDEQVMDAIKLILSK
jgi:hypothetical protein